VHEDHCTREQSEECYAELLKDPHCMQSLCSLLQEQDSEKQMPELSVLLRFLGRVSEGQTTVVIPLVMRSAQKLSQSPVTAIRRLIVLILVEFKSNSPRDFLTYLRELFP
jgi:hypothetical protein